MSAGRPSAKDSKRSLVRPVFWATGVAVVGCVIYFAARPRVYLQGVALALPATKQEIPQDHPLLDSQIAVHIGERRFSFLRKDLGLSVDVEATHRQLKHLGRTGDTIVDWLTAWRTRFGRLNLNLETRINYFHLLAVVRRLKQEIDRDPVGVRLDLARGAVHPAAAGKTLPLLPSARQLAQELRRGTRRVRLELVESQVDATTAPATLNIAAVLGQYQTVYSLADKDSNRAHNLRMAAERLDGYVIDVDSSLSFNAVVGPRDAEHGYLPAPVITAGQLVEGIAGGACQLSTTIFAAAFFAGLDLRSSRPHTIRSSYVKMGLDAAVVYPNTDLVIANPYPFPVVLHLTVSQGTVSARFLGARRPWHRVSFVRTVQKTDPFVEIEREDPTLPLGRRLIKQRGIPGYLVERRREKVATPGGPPVVETRTLRYPPTPQILLVGRGPADKNWQPPPAPPPHRTVQLSMRIDR